MKIHRNKITICNHLKGYFLRVSLFIAFSLVMVGISGCVFTPTVNTDALKQRESTEPEPDKYKKEEETVKIIIDNEVEEEDGPDNLGKSGDELHLDFSSISKTQKIALDNVNVRSEPSVDSEIIGKLQTGQEVRVYRTIEAEWCEIDFGGIHAYVDSRYLSNAEQDTMQQLLSNSSGYSYSEMESALYKYASENPSFVSLSSLGETLDGRQIYCLRIGNESSTHKVLVTGAIHAREYITTDLVMMQVDDYIRNIVSDNNYNGYSYSDILTDAVYYVVPMVNPDGVSISQFGIEGLQKESTKDLVRRISEMDGASDYSTYYRHWKSNAEGIDINRQFDAMWEQYDDNVGHPSADHYKGTAVGITAEACALIDLTNRINFDRTISYHTAGGVIYWYFGQTGQLYDDTKSFAERISSVTGYYMDSNYQSLDPAGYKDWAISKKGIPSITIEVGSGESPLDYPQLSEIYDRNKTVFEETVLSLW